MSESEIQNCRSGRCQCLVTYSQVDCEKFPTRESFGNMVQEEFERGNSQVKVSHWACCKEMHERMGFHYHCCVKLTGVKKWLSVKNNIMKQHNIVLNFLDSHNHYVYAYRYMCKWDMEVAHSLGHPDLSAVGSPRTKASMSANREASRKRKSTDIATSKHATGGRKAKR